MTREEFWYREHVKNHAPDLKIRTKRLFGRRMVTATVFGRTEIRGSRLNLYKALFCYLPKTQYFSPDKAALEYEQKVLRAKAAAYDQMRKPEYRAFC